jgi:hypothetical protein
MKEKEYESEEYIGAYDKCAAFGTYESISMGAPGAKVKK